MTPQERKVYLDGCIKEIEAAMTRRRSALRELEYQLEQVQKDVLHNQKLLEGLQLQHDIMNMAWCQNEEDVIKEESRES